MKYTTIEQYFEKDDLDCLLKDSQYVFEDIDEIQGMFQHNAYTTSTEYRSVLNKLTGHYMYLAKVFGQAQAYKETREDNAHFQLRTEAEKEGKKVTADSLKTDAHRAVSIIIRVRNLFEAYTNSCQKGIITCQSQLNQLEIDLRYKPSSPDGTK